MKNYVCITGDELTGKVRELSYCPNCGELHETEYGKEKINDEWVESKLLAFVKCNKNNKQYLIGVDGKCLNLRND